MANNTSFGFGTPFEEQLAFFKAKLNLPTERWDDIKKSANDRAFIVAGAGKADLLDDLHGAMQKRIEDGRGLNAFRADFSDVVKRHGWTGWTGQGTKAGEAWRTRIIYSTNMATSYAAGRWKQLTHPDLLKVRPYWRYHHADGVIHPRPLHLAWNGLTLRYDHVFWQTHFAPNGWLCHCWISAVDASEYAQALKNGKGTPPAGWSDINPKTGAPVGIDKGFDYAPGAAANTSLRQMVQDKLIDYPPAISKALSHDVNRYINAKQDASVFAREVLADPARVDPLWLGFIENFQPIKQATQVDAKGYMLILPAEAPRHVETSHGHDGGGQRPAVPDDYTLLWEVINRYDSIQLGAQTFHGMQTIIVKKQIGSEIYRAVFEVRPGKKNRALALWSLVIKLL